MKLRYFRFTIVLTLYLLNVHVLCFAQPHGKLLIQNYNLIDIGSSSGAFWSIIKDNRGILYFGGEEAVFEFDGTTWHKIPIPNKSAVRSLAIDDNGRIYVGGVSEFGYLSADKDGNTVYVSLLDKLSSEKFTFPDIWSVNAIDDVVYFQSAERLFIYRNDELRTLEIQNSYHRSFIINRLLLLNQENIGLCRFSEDHLELMDGGEFFRNMIISSMTLFERGQILVGTRMNGLFLYDSNAFGEGKVIPYNSEASEFLKSNQLYHGIELPGNKYAFSSLQKGVIIMNRQGEIIEYINKSNGSDDFTSYYLYLTNESELWITSGHGISLYNINSTLSYWDEELDLMGSVSCITEFKKTLFVGTNSGLFTLDLYNHKKGESTYEPEKFTQVNNLETEVWDILIVNPEGDHGSPSKNKLLAATRKGLYDIEKKSLVFETGRVGELSMFQSVINPSIIYLNAHPTFYILQYQGGKWKSIWERDISSYVISIVEDQEGDVWLGTMYYGLFKISLGKLVGNLANTTLLTIPDSLFENVSIENYNENDGLPTLTMLKPHLFHGQLMITGEGILTYDSKTNKFIRAKNFGESVENWDAMIEDFEEDKFGNIWGSQNKILDKQTDGQYQIVSLPYRMLTINNSAMCYYHDAKGYTWIGGEHELLRYGSQEVNTVTRNEFYTLIRKVTIGSDSLIFGGAHVDNTNNKFIINNIQPESNIPSIKYKSKSISFVYSCPYYRDDIPLKYSYMLEGYDENWSDWSSLTFKEYNNLREKSYTFRVRAINYSGEISNEAAYTFIITPPWYRTLLAYIIFALIIINSLYFGIKRYVKNLKESNINLEKLVRERTSELELQKEEVHQQAVKLKNQNDKLTVQRNRMSEMSKEILKTNRDKLRFFTNISHELRTPLTLILGPIGELSNENLQLSNEQTKNKLSIVNKNASRLLALVNQILDFRKLEIARPKLCASEGDIVSFSSELTSCFTELAVKKNINLVFQSKEKEITTWFDADKTSKVLFNLISNAFKYTNEGDNIVVDLEFGKDESISDKDSTVIKLKVSDSGVGMSQEVLSKIFDRYYQSGKSFTLEQAGTGIGLSMSANLAEIHHGKIEVESEIGTGSVFTLVLPYGVSYLKEEEKQVVEKQDVIKSIKNRAEKEVVKFLNISARKKRTTVDKDSDRDLVLIVEDSEDIRSYIISGIEKKYDFIEAENGEEGFELAIKHNPNVIISDIRMPKMNGFQLCTKLKSTIEISHIPIVLLTSKSAAEDQKQGLELGADAYITKPFNLEMLEARIENLIQASNRMRQKFSKDLVYKPADIVITSADEKFLSKSLKVVEANLSNPLFDVELFSKEVAMSQSTLYRKLKALTGVSTNNFIREFRLKQAASILLNNDLPVSEVSLMVGFDDPAYFAKSFKHKFGKSPTDYVKENR